MSRLSALRARKSDQFDLLEQNWEKLLEYLGSTSGEQFAEDCRAAQPSQSTSIACELAYLSCKLVAELEQALLRTRAFVSQLRCTDVRSITAVTLRLDHFSPNFSGPRQQRDADEPSSVGQQHRRSRRAVACGGPDNNATLTYLNLNNNNIGAQGARSLAAALDNNATLTFLNLNNIGAQGARSLAAAPTTTRRSRA